MAELPSAPQATEATAPETNHDAVKPSVESIWFNSKSWPFWGVHAAALFAPLSGLHWKWILLAIVSYYIRMFGVTAGFHRYFAHRSYKTSRWFQFVLAVLAETSAQKGVLWWAGHHRHHHRYSDQPEDLHSPKQRGFWYAHMGWFLAKTHDATPFRLIKDFAKFPELRWLDAYYYVPTVAYAALMLLLFGWPGLFWGFFVSTVLLWHGTFTINSLAHVIGRRVWPTADTSKNSFWLALITLGEGWHNNHHHYQRSTRQGWHWWQIDGSYYVLWLLERMRIVWDMHRPKLERAAVRGG